MTSPIDYTLDIYQGATFELNLEIKDGTGAAMDLTGASLAGKMRKLASDAAATASFTCTITNAASGLATISLTAAQTAAIVANPSVKATREITNFCYDIELTDSLSKVTRILQGVVNFWPEVTK